MKNFHFYEEKIQMVLDGCYMDPSAYIVDWKDDRSSVLKNDTARTRSWCVIAFFLCHASLSFIFFPSFYSSCGQHSTYAPTHDSSFLRFRKFTRAAAIRLYIIIVLNSPFIFDFHASFDPSRDYSKKSMILTM